MNVRSSIVRQEDGDLDNKLTSFCNVIEGPGSLEKVVGD